VIVIHLATMLFSSLKVQINFQMIPLKQFLQVRVGKVVDPSMMTQQRCKRPCGCISNNGLTSCVTVDHVQL